MAAIELEDPLRDSSLLSLLPKTLTATAHAQIAGSEAEDLESVEGFFKSMVVKGSMQLVQQAQTITKSYTNSHGLHPEDGSFAANCKNRQPERRPALGRKRAKFSLKPGPSHSLPSIDISSTIDHIDDPEEYFLAFEQLENAEKELKKLRGEVHTDQVQNHQGATARKRRPGLRGKTASYKHHTSANDETAETFVESQEKHLDLIEVHPCNLLYSDPVDEPDTSQAKNTNSELQESTASELQESTASEGHVAEKEKNVDILLEKVLSSFKDFDGDEGETYLRESLHIMPIDAVKIDLPPLPIQLSQHSMLNNRAARGELNNSEISSPITRSPIEAISVMQRRILLKDPLKDLYSSFPVTDAPDSGGSSLSKSSGKESLFPVIVGNHNDGSSPVVENRTKLAFEDGVCSPDVEVNRSLGHKILSEEKLQKHPLLEEKRNPDHVGVLNEKGNICDEFDCMQEGNDVLLDPVVTDGPDAEVEVCNIRPRIPEILNNPSPLLGEMANCNFHADDKGEDILGGFHGSLQMQGDNLQKVLLVTNQPDTGVEDLTSTCVNETTTESLVNRFRKVGGSNGSSGTNIEEGFSDETSQSEVNVTVQEKVSETETSKDNSCPPEVTNVTDRHLETQHSLPDQHNEEHQIASGPPPDEGSIQKAPPPPPNEGSMRKAPPPRTRNKNKSTVARHSLAGGGTIWEAGRRKSSRRKFKPLEHWRGERLLYGRIHNSMATVIAVKYASPGKKSMKVESCVSEEYAELVAKVGRC